MAHNEWQEDMNPLYPNAVLRVGNCDGSVRKLTKKAIRQLVRQRASAGDIEKFTLEATRGDYVHFINTCKIYMHVKV